MIKLGNVNIIKFDLVDSLKFIKEDIVEKFYKWKLFLKKKKDDLGIVVEKLKKIFFVDLDDLIFKRIWLFRERKIVMFGWLRLLFIGSM